MRDLLRIVSSAKSLRKYYVSISLLTILLALANLLQPLLSGWAIDEIRQGQSADLHYVVWLAVGIFVLDVLANLFSNVSGYLGDQVALRLNRFLSRNYYQHLMSLPQQFFDTELTGKIINRLSRSINQITNFVNMTTNNFMQFIFSTIFTLGIVAYYSWPVALLLLAIYPVYIFMTAKTSKKWRAWQTEKNTEIDIASGRFAEVINQIKVVKSFLQERPELRFFRSRYDKALAINRPQSRYWHMHDIYRRVVLSLIFLVVYIVIFVQGVNGDISPGTVVALILYSSQIRIPIFTISFMVDNAQRAITDSRDYFEIMEIKPAITDKPGATTLQVKKGAVSFDNLSFAYAEGKPVFKGLNFEVPSRQKVALVGESGEGKTTLTNLLLRLYEPGKGTISIDGQDVASVTQASLRSQIGIVFQEPALFSGTIKENIAYGRPDASLADIEAAAKAANAHDFIAGFEKGYDTEIGERGLKLSGGQKQRIAIARAILKDAPILILDEATSSLDSRSEHLVQTALDRLMRNRTTIIIAHRLSTIEHVDRIVTLKGGRVDEMGTPAELAVSGGIYANLLSMQQRGSSKDNQRLKKYGIKG